MYRDTRGAPAPQPHSKSASIDQESTYRRLAGKGFGILRNNPDGSTDFYRLLSFSAGGAGLCAWFAVGNDLISYPVIGFAAVLISHKASKLTVPSIEAAIAVEGAIELAVQTAGFIGIAPDEQEIRRVLGISPRRDGRSS